MSNVTPAAPQSQCADGDAFEGQTWSSLRDFIRTESGSAGLLVIASLVALLWANSPWSQSYVDLFATPIDIRFGDGSISMDLHHWINDGLMAIFFFVIGLEVRRELSIGELTDRKRVVVPVVAGITGMVVPALLYLALNPSGEAARGWGTVLGTDTAFLLGVMALVGPRVSTQLRIFLLTLTVIDDIVAVSIIGIVYSDDIEAIPLVIAALCLVVLVALARAGVWRAAPYLVVVIVLWVATLQSGLHASIAGMISGLLVPALAPRRADVDSATSAFRAFRQSPMPGMQRRAREELTRAISVNDRLQEVLHWWTGYVIVPIFALANAGIDLRGGVFGEAMTSPVTWGVILGLVVGKLVGIGAGALAAVRFGWGRLPQGVGMGHTLAGGALSGIGFTVALLIVGLAFTDPIVRAEAAIGVLLSAVLATIIGWIMFIVSDRVLREGDAALPRTLSESVDPVLDNIRGNVDAPLTLVEYLDFECPFCALTTGVAEDVRAHFGDRLRYVARQFPLEAHPHAMGAALAAEAAGIQGRYWEMHDLLFARHDELEYADLVGYASDLGLDVEQFLRDLDDERLAARIHRDVASAEASGVRAVPTFFIGTRRHVGPHDSRSLIAALEANGRRRTTSSPQ